MSIPNRPEPRPEPATSPIQDSSVGTCQVASFYCFTTLADAHSLRLELEQRCRTGELFGTVLLAAEGLNATLAGPAAAIDEVVSYLRSLPGFADMRVLSTSSDRIPFRRLKIRLRPEIVSFGQSHLAPAVVTGKQVKPARWNELIQRDDIVLIDTRNEYEIGIGSFAGAINPHTTDFRDFPQFVERELGADPTTPIAMFCTGGIRCEKASAYLLQRGYREVYQLEGGILNYLGEVPREHSQWRGDCFVFDERVALDHDLNEAGYSQCFGCRRPLSAEDRASPHYVEGISCPACHANLSEAQRNAFAERRRQVELASAKNIQHVGAQMPRREKG